MKKDYISIALDMLDTIAKDDIGILAVSGNASMIYAGTNKIANRESINMLIDEVIDIFSKAKELMKEKEDFPNEETNKGQFS